MGKTTDICLREARRKAICAARAVAAVSAAPASTIEDQRRAETDQYVAEYQLGQIATLREMLAYVALRDSMTREQPPSTRAR